MSDDEINRMDVARHLLPPPGDEVAGQLIAEVRRLRLTGDEATAIRLGEFAFPGLRVTDNGRWVDVWATLRGLLERHGPTGSVRRSLM